MKMAKCIMELERIKGIKVGINQYNASEIISEPKTQSDLAEEIGVNERQLRNYKKLTNLIPELQNMIEEGSMKATVGYNIWAKMPQDLMIVSEIRSYKHNILKVVKILILFII